MSENEKADDTAPQSVDMQVWYNDEGGISVRIINNLDDDKEGSDANYNLYCWVRGIVIEGMKDLVKYADIGHETLDPTDEDDDEPALPFPQTIGNA